MNVSRSQNFVGVRCRRRGLFNYALVVCLTVLGCKGNSPPIPTGPLSGFWDVSHALAGAGSKCSQELEASPTASWHVNPEAEQWAYDENFSILASLGDGAAIYDVELQCLVGATQTDPDLKSGEFRCEGEVAGLRYQPTDENDATFALKVSMTGQLAEKLVCTEVDEYRYDSTAFYAASWTVTVLDACEGAGCGASEVPAGADGGALCIQDLAVSAQWSGCAEDGNVCLGDDEPSAEAPCLN